MREAVVSMIFTHCSAENLMPQSTLMPTTDSNKLEISSIQEALRELKVSVVSDKQEKRLLGAARVSHCSLSGGREEGKD